MDGGVIDSLLIKCQYHEKISSVIYIIMHWNHCQSTVHSRHPTYSVQKRQSLHLRGCKTGQIDCRPLHERERLRQRLFTSGIVLSATGAGIIAGSVLFDVIYSSTQNNQATGDIHIETYYLPVVSLIGTIVGGTLLVASIPLYWVGTVKLKKAATLSFTPPSGGLGLAVNF